MGRRRRRNTAEALALFMYWASGIAFFVEPFRWAAKSNAKKRQRDALAASHHAARATAAAAAAQRALAEQQAWEVYERRQRATAAAQPKVCNYCKFWNPPDAVKCANCGAH